VKSTHYSAFFSSSVSLSLRCSLPVLAVYSIDKSVRITVNEMGVLIPLAGFTQMLRFLTRTPVIAIKRVARQLVYWIMGVVNVTRCVGWLGWL